MKNDVSDAICMYRCRFIYKFVGGIVLGVYRVHSS